jgi:hypothetical protein
VVQGESDAAGENGRRRSVPLFDPVAGMRAMADIQADGLRAASDLLERMLTRDGDGPAVRSLSPERDYAALVDAWAQVLQGMASGLARPVAPGPVTVPVDSGAMGPPVRLVLAGEERADDAAAEIWLHNGTSAAVGPLCLRCGELVAPDGEVLQAGVEFDPPEVLSLPPRSSRGVVLSVRGRAPRRPGIYRGTIQADGAPALWLPVEVAVEPC